MKYVIKGLKVEVKDLNRGQEFNLDLEEVSVEGNFEELYKSVVEIGGEIAKSYIDSQLQKED